MYTFFDILFGLVAILAIAGTAVFLIIGAINKYGQ